MPSPCDRIVNGTHPCAEWGGVIDQVRHVLRGAQRPITAKLRADDVRHGLGDEFVNVASHAGRPVVQEGVSEFIGERVRDRARSSRAEAR